MKNLSIRGARVEFCGRFKESIADHQLVILLNDLHADVRSCTLARLPKEVVRRVLRCLLGRRVANGLLDLVDPLVPPGLGEYGFRIGVRKRPVWEDELSAGEFDTLSVSRDRSQVVLHDGRLDRNQTTFTYHREFAMDHLFDETCSSETVYRESCHNLVGHAISGGHATIIMFGQTGTGKTHTALESRRCSESSS